MATWTEKVAVQLSHLILDKGGKIINGGGTTVYLNEEKMINEEKIINGAGTTVYLHGKE